MSKWIDYDKKKPKVFKEVLVAFKSMQGTFCITIGMYYNKELVGYVGGRYGAIKSSKTYWMKLPKEPKY